MKSPFFKSKLAYTAPEIVVFAGDGNDGPFGGSGDDFDTFNNDVTGNDQVQFELSI